MNSIIYVFVALTNVMIKVVHINIFITWKLQIAFNGISTSKQSS